MNVNRLFRVNGMSPTSFGFRGSLDSITGREPTRVTGSASEQNEQLAAVGEAAKKRTKERETQRQGEELKKVKQEQRDEERIDPSDLNIKPEKNTPHDPVYPDDYYANSEAVGPPENGSTPPMKDDSSDGGGGGDGGDGGGVSEKKSRRMKDRENAIRVARARRENPAVGRDAIQGGSERIDNDRLTDEEIEAMREQPNRVDNDRLTPRQIEEMRSTPTEAELDERRRKAERWQRRSRTGVNL